MAAAPAARVSGSGPAGAGRSAPNPGTRPAARRRSGPAIRDARSDVLTSRCVVEKCVAAVAASRRAAGDAIDARRRFVSRPVSIETGHASAHRPSVAQVSSASYW